MGPAGRLVTIRRSGADGAHFPLSLSTCLFGRGVECDIRIQLPVVSRQHCKIEVGEQAVLFNLSSANPTQVNGATIDGPVRLKHGDVITVVDRSFRYEDDRHQGGSASAEFPGQRHGQAAPRRVSRSSFSPAPDGEVEGRGAAHSQLTEEGASGEPPARTEGIGVARNVSSSSGGPAPRSPLDRPRSEPLRDNLGNALGSPAGALGEGARGTLVSRNGGPEALPSPWGLEKGGEKESPFRKLYESMKEKLDVKSEKENVLQSRRKSGSRGHCAGDSESAGGSWGETPLPGSPRCRRRARRSSPAKAVPAPGQREEGRTGEGPGPTVQATASPSVPPMQTTGEGSPVQCSRRNSSPERRSGGRSGVRGSGPAHPGQSATFTPKELFPGHGTPTTGDSAEGFGNTPEKVFSRKRRSSLPPKVDTVATEAETPKPAALTPLLVHVERKGQGGSLGPPQPRRATAGPPGLRSAGVGDWDEPIHKVEGVPSKTRRVSFGGHLRPELFDENLPPNTPLKRGETPTKRRSLVTHAPAVLKKVIKGQPQESGKEGSSEIRLEVTAQNQSVSSPAGHPTKSPSVANAGRRRSSKPPAWSGSQSPPQTEVPKRRRSSGAPSPRASVGRGQHGLLQTIQSRRRSGASEANLVVAKSWADIVKLSTKQTQAKAVRRGPVRRGPPRRPSKRPRRVKTPKTPTGRAYSEFSTGHANSPCTIVIGRAHVERVAVPARPYRMLSSVAFGKKIDFSEDLSGLTEMFKTPAKEKPKKMSLCPTTFSHSEGLCGKQAQVPESEEKPLTCAPAKLGENVSPGAQNVPEEPSDEQSASPALRRQYMTVKNNAKTPPSETEPSKAAPSVNRPRRSVGLRDTPGPGTECEKEDPEFDTVESVSGRHLGKPPGQAQLAEREMKGSEGAFATWNGNFESKEDSGKRIAVRRSRRSSELKGAPREDVITTERLQERKSMGDLVDTQCLLQTPGHAEAPVGVENRATVVCGRSPKPEPVSTPAKVHGRIKTPARSVSAEVPSALREPTPTPGGSKHTRTEPAGGDESMKASKKFSEQQQDSADHVTGSRRRSRTPKRKPQPIEDLAGVKELFQTPKHTVETVTEDKTMKTPSKSPEPEPVSGPSSTKRRPRTPPGTVDVEGELSALREPTPTPGETTHPAGEPGRDAEDIGALTGTPDQKRDSAEHAAGSRRRSRTPRRKAEPTEDLTGFRELFQTPYRAVETVTEVKTMKTPSKSPKPEPISRPSSTKRRLRTPPGTVDMEEGFSGLRKPTPTPGRITCSPRGPGGDAEDIGALTGTPEQKRDSSEHVTGSRRRSRTPRRKAEPTEDLTGFKELFQTPYRAVETVTNNKATKILSKSPEPEPVSTPTSTKRRPRTPPGTVDVEEELSALRGSTLTPGETTHSAGEPGGDGEGIGALKGTPNQKQDSAEHAAGSRRRSRTPKRKAEPTEDLTGFKELFQTPNHIVEPVTEDITMKIPSKSPKLEPVSTPATVHGRIKTPACSVSAEALSTLREPTPTPGGSKHIHTEPAGGDESMKASKKFPERQQDSADHVTGSRRRSRTPRRKAEPTEDLTGFRELFQTPYRAVETVTEVKTMKTPSKSPKPEPISRPSSTKRRLRTPPGTVDMEEGFSGLRKPTPTPGRITCSPRGPGGDAEDIGALTGTPEQKRDSSEHVTGSRRRSRTPRRKAEPTEDLTGFKELFQTPYRAVETVTNNKATKILSKSPEPEPVSTPTSTKRRPRTPLGTVDVEEELSALRGSTLTPGETTHSAGEPGGDGEGIGALKGTPNQKQDSAEHAAGSRRRSRTPKRKAEPTEDLTGFKELFQTPNHIVEPVTEDITMKIPSKSPKLEPVSTPATVHGRIKTPACSVSAEALSTLREPTPTPGGSKHIHTEPAGGDESMKASKKFPERQQDSADHVTGSRRRSRTPRRKAEPTEDLTGFKELFQTPSHTDEPMAEDMITEIPSKSPEPEPVSTPTSTKRRLRTPLGTVDVEGELSALREPTPTPGETTHSAGEPGRDAEDIGALTGTPDQKLDSSQHVTASRRRSRTPRRKAEPTEDLTGFRELFQTPYRAVETVTNNKATKILSKSPEPEPVSTPTSTKRRPRTPPGTVDVEEELSALRGSTLTPGETTHSAGEPGGDGEGIGALTGTPDQKRDSAEHAAGSRRRSRTPTRANPPTEDLAGFRELFQTPRHTAESVIEDKATEMPCKSAQAKPAVVPAGRNRRLRAPPGKVAVKDEPSGLWSPTRTSRRTARSHRELEGGDKDMKLLKESPEQKLHSAENVPASKRKARTRKEKAQRPEDLASLQELSQTPDPTEDPVSVAKSTAMPSGPPQAEAVVVPARTRRQLKAPPGTVAVQEEPSALRRPMGTSGKTTRSHREQEGADRDMKLFKKSPERKLDPAENVPASKRKPRTRKEKAQFPADPASLQELSQTADPTEDPVSVAESTAMPSRPPQAEAVVVPARTRRQLKAPPGTVAVQEEPSALRRPTGTSGKTTRSHREPVDGAEDVKVCTGPPRREAGPVGTAVGSGRQLRSRTGKAQPPHSPAGSRRLLRSPAGDTELGTDAAGLTPDQSKPATTSRRARRARDSKPTEEPVDSRDPVKAPSASSAALSPKRKREDGSCAGPRRLRPRTRAQDPAEEMTPLPPRKRLRTAPREQCAPPEPSEPRKGRRVLREVIELVDDLPIANGKTKKKGRKDDVTSPDKGASLRSGLPSETGGAEQGPEPLTAAEKGHTKRNEKKPVRSSQEVESQNLEGGARGSAPGDKVPERRRSPRPGRRGTGPAPRGAEEKVQASSVETRGETREEKEGAPRSGVICLRSRKVTVPPAGDTLQSQPKQRGTRSAKRPVGDANKENDAECVKKMRTRSRRGQ